MPPLDRAFARPAAFLPLILLPALLVAGGCTMCPDPFDYSGPVPNGSVTQNDFAARSNGTRPVRSTPFPWPPVVDSSRRPTPADEPDTMVLVASESPLPEGEGVAGSVVAEAPRALAEDGSAADEPSASVAFVPDSGEAPVVSGATSVPPGVVPPRGAWMTQDRRLPPPGNVVPPSQRRPSSTAPQSTGWRAAARSALGR